MKKNYKTRPYLTKYEKTAVISEDLNNLQMDQNHF